MKKHEEEQLALDSLRAVSGLLPGTVVRGSDPPDFIVTDGARRISVEMTRYHQDSGPRGSERARQEVLERRAMTTAQQLFQASHPDVDVFVSPMFRMGSLRRDSVRDVAERIAQLVAHAIPTLPADSNHLATIRVDWDAFDRVGLGQVLIHLTVHRFLGSRAGPWQPQIAGHMSTDLASIERPMRAKEADLPSYKATVDESWLVIYVPFGHASAFFDTEVLTPQMFDSTFDRVIFLDPARGRSEIIA